MSINAFEINISVGGNDASAPWIPDTAYNDKPFIIMTPNTTAILGDGTQLTPNKTYLVRYITPKTSHTSLTNAEMLLMEKVNPSVNMELTVSAVADVTNITAPKDGQMIQVTDDLPALSFYVFNTNATTGISAADNTVGKWNRYNSSNIISEKITITGVTASNNINTSPPSLLLDNDEATGYGNNNILPTNLYFDLGTPKPISGFSMARKNAQVGGWGNNSYSPKHFKIYYNVDAADTPATRVYLAEYQNQLIVGDAPATNYLLNEPISHQYYGIEVLDNVSTDPVNKWLNITNFEFFSNSEIVDAQDPYIRVSGNVNAAVNKKYIIEAGSNINLPTTPSDGSYMTFVPGNGDWSTINPPVTWSATAPTTVMKNTDGSDQIITITNVPINLVYNATNNNWMPIIGQGSVILQGITGTVTPPTGSAPVATNFVVPNNNQNTPTTTTDVTVNDTNTPDKSTSILIDPNDANNTATVGNDLVIPNVGTFTIDANGLITFTPLSTFVGTYSINRTIANATGVSNVATVSGEVIAVATSTTFSPGDATHPWKNFTNSVNTATDVTVGDGTIEPQFIGNGSFEKLASFDVAAAGEDFAIEFDAFVPTGGEFGLAHFGITPDLSANQGFYETDAGVLLNGADANLHEYGYTNVNTIAGVVNPTVHIKFERVSGVITVTVGTMTPTVIPGTWNGAYEFMFRLKKYGFKNITVTK